MIKKLHDLKGKTIAVFGASSNIGRNFIEDAAKRGAKVIAIARNTNKINQVVNKKIEIVQGDITQLKDVEKALRNKNVDATINFAASFSSDITEARKVNVIGEKYILSASKKFNVKRHIYISTIATQMPKSNIYRDTKLEAEKEVKKAGKGKKIEWMILRFANVLGTPTWDQPFKIIIPYLRLGVPKIPTSSKAAQFTYLTIYTAAESVLSALVSKPNQTITIFDGQMTIGQYLSCMEKQHHVKRSFLPLRPLQTLNKLIGKKILFIAGLTAVSEFLANPPLFENETMKRELNIKPRQFPSKIIN
jgi:nucleoside-diphosphate-sugar epimerase